MGDPYQKLWKMKKYTVWTLLAGLPGFVKKKYYMVCNKYDK